MWQALPFVMAILLATLIPLNVSALLGGKKTESAPAPGAPIAQNMEIKAYRGVPYTGTLRAVDNEGDAPSIYDEIAPESLAAEEVEDEAEDEAETMPEEPEAEETPAQEEPAAADPIALLVDAGLPEDVANQIAVIFTESGNLRAAYNRLRATFGNTTGREYYQLVKDIAARQ